MISTALSCLDATDNEALIQAFTDWGVSFCDGDAKNDASAAVVVFDHVGENLCSHISRLACRIPGRVIAMAACSECFDRDGIYRLIEMGASDVVTWDTENNTVAHVAARLRRWELVDQLTCSPEVQNRVIGRSPAWLAALRQIVEAARFSNDAILIDGETGTGKELAAQVIHSVDCQHGQRELSIVNCAAIVPGLSGSEFFGHERGAFTGAASQRDGAFALADGGVLFLDEVGELPLSLQAQLLRVLQEKRYKRVGGNAWHKTDFRLVCATNRDLLQEIEAGRFRRDLYYRLAGWTVTLPPLSKRREEILPLATHFLRQPDDTSPELDSAVQHHLVNRAYPGNIRDLRQLCLRMRGRHVGDGQYTIGDVPSDELHGMVNETSDWRRGDLEAAVRKALVLGFGLKEISSAAADVAIDVAMAEHKGSTAKIAKQLKITPRALQLRKRQESS